MKKFIITACLISFLFAPMLVLGESVIPDPEPPVPGVDPLAKDRGVMDILEDVFHWMWIILLAVAVLMILIAAFLFLTSGGTEESVTKARGMILYAVIAIIVAAASYGIVAIIRGAAVGTT